LRKALDLGRKEHLALVGAGGKTSLMFALAAELQKNGERVVTSTTTKIWQAEARKSPCTVFIKEDPSWEATLLEGLRGSGHVFLGSARLRTGKVEGIAPLIADTVYGNHHMEVLILEADGAAGRPVKAPGGQEPVIPASATMVIAMLGLEAVGSPFGPESVFRPEAVRNLTGLGEGEIMGPESLVNLFVRPEGLFRGAPERSRKVAFLNKWDLLPDKNGAASLAEGVLEQGAQKIERVIAGSVLGGIYYVYLGSGRPN
jgi:probable selenium-dependent hydroxylase accessory protein YqeC